MAEADFISDLVDGTAFAPGGDTVSANTGSIDPNRGAPATEAPVEKQAPVVEKTDVPAKPLSLRDQISSAIKGETDTPAAAQENAGLVRDPVTGQFAPKVVDPAVIVDPNAPPAAAQVISPPRGLSAQDAEVFSKLPAEMQQYVARTMDSVNEQATRYAALGQLEQVIAPRRQAWALNGMTEAQVINQLFALSDFAAEKPGEFIQYIAQQRGIDLEELVFGAEPVDPTVLALQQELGSVKQQLTGFTTQQQQIAHQSVIDEVVAFADEKDAQGQPKRPYFADLGDSIMPFIAAVQQQQPGWSRSQILQEAYDRASWGTPAVRAKIQASAEAAREATRIKEQQDAAKRARQAGSGVATGVPTAEPSAANSGSTNLRETIRASIAAHT